MVKSSLGLRSPPPMASRQDTGPLDAAIGGALLIVGPLLAAFGAVLLLMSLFLEWYEPNLSGWTVFETVDLVLALAALAGIALSLASLALAIDVPGAALGRAGLVALRHPILPALGAVALVVAVSQLVSEPPPVVDDSPQVGAWLALAGAALLAAGGILASTRVSLDPRGGRGGPGGTGAPGGPGGTEQAARAAQGPARAGPRRAPAASSERTW